jgi:hypothetical protein
MKHVNDRNNATLLYLVKYNREFYAFTMILSSLTLQLPVAIDSVILHPLYIFSILICTYIHFMSNYKHC